MTYIHGKGHIIPGLEKEVSGMRLGAEKRIQVKPEDGYGLVNPNAFQEVPKEKLPPEALKVGRDADGSGALMVKESRCVLMNQRYDHDYGLVIQWRHASVLRCQNLRD